MPKAPPKPKKGAAAARPAGKVTPPVDPSGAGPTLYGTPVGAGKDQGELVRRSNMWRDNYNPMRLLTIQRLLVLFEYAERGAFAEVQLLIRKARKRFPVLRGFIEKLLSSIEELNWDVKVMENLPQGANEAMAEKQRQFLRSRYDLLDNFNGTLGQLALAEIHGYTVLQKHRYTDGPNDGAVRELYWIEPWCWARDGYYGDFYYNEISRFGVGLGSCNGTLGEDNRIGSENLPRENFVIREEENPLYEIALIAFVNWLMGRKDWAAFTEIFGLLNAVVIMPPNIGNGKEDEYTRAAEKVANGVSGALPHGSDVKFPTQGGRSAMPPMKGFCDAQMEDFVMAATGGELTMISKPTGIGKGASEEHDRAWQKIAAMKARRINEVLQADFDMVELEAQFPGEPVCVYFELAAKDEENVGEVADTVIKLEGVGYETDTAEISERTGFKLTRQAAVADIMGGEPAAPGQTGGAMGTAQKPDLAEKAAARIDKGEFNSSVRNRRRAATLMILNSHSADVEDFSAAVSADVAPVLQRLQAITEIKDDALFEAKLKEFYTEFPQLQSDILKDPKSDRAMLPIITKALLAALKNKTTVQITP